jgi:molecular chaperone HtpG
MTSKFQKKAFSSDTAKILEILTHRLYNEKDVFLKELISNSSDACNKILFLISSMKYNGMDYSPKILIAPNTENNTISIIDNGIGMDQEDMQNFLGTIANSHTGKTIADLEGSNDHLIGQFGIGFYSSFIVSTEVSVWSKKYGSDQAYLWVSDGKNAYEISEADAPFFPMENNHGTQIMLKLRDEDKELTNTYNIREIIKKYSNYIKIPIFFLQEEEKDGQINEAIIPWREKTVSPEVQQNIYKNMLGGTGDIYFTIHQNMEGEYIYSRLLFIPSRSFYIPITRDQKPVIHLYVNGVFICNDQDFLPLYLRFVRGIVEARDLPININRETVRNNPVVEKMRRSALSKILEELVRHVNSDRENYIKNFWEIYGMILKEGIIEDYEHKTLVMDACLFRSGKTGDYITLKEYISDCKEDQKEIYYFLSKGNTKHPLVESFINNHNCDILILKEELEKLCFDHAMSYESKNFVSIMDKREAAAINEQEKNVIQECKEILKEELQEVEGIDNVPENILGFLLKDTNFMNFSLGNNQAIKMCINTKHALFQKAQEAMANNHQDKFHNIIENIYCFLKLQEHTPNKYQSNVNQQIDLFCASL